MDCNQILMDENEKMDSKNDVGPGSLTSAPQSLDTQSHDNHAGKGMFSACVLLQTKKQQIYSN